MKLHVIGSGSCVVNQGKTTSSYILEIAERTLMIDTGTGSTRTMRKTKFSTEDLDAIINTHRHADHVSDLIPIIQDKVVRSFQQNEPDVVLIGPKNHKKYLRRRMHDEMRQKPKTMPENFDFKLNVQELTPDHSMNNLEINSIPAVHGPEDFPCLSIKIQTGNQKIVFTGDTDYNEELINFSEDADILVTDCSKPDEEKVEGHMTPTESAKIAENAGVDTLVLSHLYPEAENSDLNEKAAETFSGDIMVAEDLMTIQK